MSKPDWVEPQIHNMFFCTKHGWDNGKSCSECAADEFFEWLEQRTKKLRGLKMHTIRMFAGRVETKNRYSMQWDWNCPECGEGNEGSFISMDVSLPKVLECKHCEAKIQLKSDYALERLFYYEVLKPEPVKHTVKMEQVSRWKCPNCNTLNFQRRVEEEIKCNNCKKKFKLGEFHGQYGQVEIELTEVE